MTTDLKELTYELRAVARCLPDNVSAETCGIIDKAADALEARLCAVVKPRGKLFFDEDGDICHDQGGFNLVACPSYGDGVGDRQLNPEYVTAMVDAFNVSRSAVEVAAEARAAAIEAAALECEQITKPTLPPSYFGGRGGDVYDAGQSAACKSKAVAIRALHDTDTLDAIERIKEQARQEERERCANIAEDFGCCHVPEEIAKAIMEGE